MKELNHRVKNNLAMVSSLVSLKESETKIDLSSLKNRIEVITRLHDELSRKNDMKRIEVKEYFQQLLESVFSFKSNQKIQIHNTIDEVIIPSKTAIPLGLIVNEIATNAIKHGFTSGKEACFTIEMSLSSEDRQYVLKLSNTGNPFPEDSGMKKPETMGLQLVSSLVDQLDGTIELQKEPNTAFTIRFPVSALRA